MDTRSGWGVSSGIVLGRTHAALRKNRQDALASGQCERGAYGVVSDGCGSSPHSEVGAKLTAAIAASVLRAALHYGDSPMKAVRDAHAAVLHGLEKLVLMSATSNWDAEAFAHEHLLATLIAFAMTENETALVMVGDGIVRVDGEVVARAHDDAPWFVIAGGGAEVFRTFPRARSVAIATDGFDLESFDAIAAMRAPDLTRHMTIRQRKAGAFTDDAAIVVARREAEGGAS